MATSTGFWEDDAGATSTYSLLNPRSPNRYHLMRIMRTSGMRNYAEVLATLLADSTPASSASVTIAQVDAVATTGGTNSQGGVRGVTANETVDGILNKNVGTASANTTRAVSAADVTAMTEELSMGDAAAGHGDRIMRAPSDGSGAVSYPTDASGNGGGGKMAAGR
jgi:hypothetical protein